MFESTSIFTLLELFSLLLTEMIYTYENNNSATYRLCIFLLTERIISNLLVNNGLIMKVIQFIK